MWQVTHVWDAVGMSACTYPQKKGKIQQKQSYLPQNRKIRLSHRACQSWPKEGLYETAGVHHQSEANGSLGFRWKQVVRQGSQGGKDCGSGALWFFNGFHPCSVLCLLLACSPSEQGHGRAWCLWWARPPISGKAQWPGG